MDLAAQGLVLDAHAVGVDHAEGRELIRKVRHFASQIEVKVLNRQSCVLTIGDSKNNRPS